MADRQLRLVSRRLLVIGGVLTAAGAVALAAAYGLRPAASFVVGGGLAALNLRWLESSVERLLPSGGLAAGQSGRAAARRALVGFLARLLLILLALYATIRLHFLSVPAAVTGFAAFHCSILVEGMLEAFGNPPRT